MLTGAGRSFCAGNDLDAIASGEGRAEPMLGPETVSALEDLPQPTIAKIKGHCFTGGLELALACDFLIAADSTKLGDTHGQWGMVPIWGMSIRLPERVGLANAKDLMFTARRIDGTRAKEIGLVDQAVPDDELDAAVATLAGEICANSPGTNSTSVTPAQIAGRVMTVGATAGKTWTTEPTTLTVIREKLVTPNGGVFAYDYPLGTEPDCALGEGFAIRCTAPATVNVRATLEVSRC